MCKFPIAPDMDIQAKKKCALMDESMGPSNTPRITITFSAIPISRPSLMIFSKRNRQLLTRWK